jgi:hypothetical protein
VYFVRFTKAVVVWELCVQQLPTCHLLNIQPKNKIQLYIASTRARAHTDRALKNPYLGRYSNKIIADI